MSLFFLSELIAQAKRCSVCNIYNKDNSQKLEAGPVTAEPYTIKTFLNGQSIIRIVYSYH